MFKENDIVKHKFLNREGKVVAELGAGLLEVVVDNSEYIWSSSLVELVRNEDDYDDWDPDFFGYRGEYNSIEECVCSSWTLFHFGCKCGYVDQLKKDKKST